MSKPRNWKWLTPAAMLLFACSLLGDVIYLKNGSVLVVEKAWEEGEQLKYQSASGVESIPRASVKRVQGQRATPADPSRNRSTHVDIIRGQGAPVVSSPTAAESVVQPASESRASARSTRYKDATGYAEALREHEKSGKPIALYFYVDWCKYCARLEGKILSQSDIKQYLETILYVSVNPEHGKAEESLFERFGGRGFPTFLVLAKSQPAQEISTAVPPQAFLQQCKEAARGKSQ